MSEGTGILTERDGPPPGEDFDAPVRGAPDLEALVVSLDGFEGPLDLLLDLARAQRVDLRRISMLRLVEQYLVFVEIAKSRNLELAADYLVMASWLAYLKSKLLLPSAEAAGEEVVAVLAEENVVLRAAVHDVHGAPAAPGA